VASGAACGVGDTYAAEQRVSAASVGITLVVSTVIGLAGGYYVDRWLGTSPWFMIIGLAMGIVAGFVNLFRSTKDKQ
jgi:ATP synthase protein I